MTSIHHPDAVLLWEQLPEGLPSSQTLSLAPYTDSHIALEVQSDQVALVLDDHEAVHCFQPGLHHLLISPPGDESPDSEVARILEAVENCPRAHHLQPSQHVMFISTAELEEMSWQNCVSGKLISEDEKSGIQSSGRYRIRITRPSLYYQSFLRHSEDLDFPKFHRILNVLLLETIGKTLSEIAPQPRDLQENIDGLSRAMRPEIESSLNSVGLQLDHIALDSLQAIKSGEKTLDPAWVQEKEEVRV